MSGSNQDSGGSVTGDVTPGAGPSAGQRRDPDGPPRREKKRVGFSGGGASRLSGLVDDDYFSPNQSPTPEILGTPRPRGDGTDNGPEPAELHRALTRILVTEADGNQTTVSPPSRPRPALRRNTSYDVPEEREQADLAERRATERQQRSGAAARERADRLAVRVETYSAPTSRRGSNDMTYRPSLQTVGLDDDDLDDEAVATGAHRGRTDDSHYVRSRTNKTHRDAEHLVRSHTRRAAREPTTDESPKTEEGAPSRPGTPTYEQTYEQDFVSRPTKAKGGILSSLLRLYSEGKDSRDNSGRSTPATATPNPSPPHSRSSSRAPSVSPSVPGTPKHGRTGSGFFGYHQKSGSRSSLALTELMKSTSALMAPGSSGMSGGVSEKIKKEGVQKEKKRKSGTWGGASPPKEKKKKEQMRITKHIAEILSRHKFLVKLCRALMMYGAPTHRLEEYMASSARVLEIEGQFLYMPGCMIISFDDTSTHTTEIKIVRTTQGVDLGKLRDVHELYKEVVHDSMGVDEATAKLDAIMQRKIKFGDWWRVPMYGLASAAVAPFAFQGRLIDLPIAFLLGCILGFLQLILAPSNDLFSNVFEITAVIINSFLARAFGSINGGNTFCFSALAQSSIALILPGYMVLCGSLELQSQNLVAGSVRLVYAMIYTLFMGYGITIGTTLYGLIDREASSDTSCQRPLDREFNLLFVGAFTICLCVINQAKWKQMPIMLVISMAGYVVNSYSSDFFVDSGQTHISNMLGAFTVGILANLYSRLGKHFTNYGYKILDWYDLHVAPRFSSTKRRRVQMQRSTSMYTLSDLESRPSSPTSSPDTELEKSNSANTPVRRPASYGLAAAAMLPAIFVQVPSGLAAGGSLLAGVSSADSIIRGLNGTSTESGSSTQDADLNNSAFTVLMAVIQVAIGVTIGLFLSALMVYPLGKKKERSGLLSF